MEEREVLRGLIQDFVQRRNASLEGTRVEIAGRGQKCRQGCAYQTESFFPNLAYPCKAITEISSPTLLVPVPTVDENDIANCMSYKQNLATSLRNLVTGIYQHLPSLPF